MNAVAYGNGIFVTVGGRCDGDNQQSMSFSATSIDGET